MTVSSLSEGTPRLQPWVSKLPTCNGASAPGVCLRSNRHHATRKRSKSIPPTLSVASTTAIQIALLLAFFALASNARSQSSETIPSDQALDRILQQSSLTHGRTPFHARLAITGPTPAYSGQIDLLWFAPNQYRLTLASPTLHQLRIVNGNQVQEQNQGDFYPRWLQTFVEALLDPASLVSNFRGSSAQISVGPNITRSCVRRDDRPGNITDQLTWGILCFTGAEPSLQSVLTFNRSIDLSGYQPFGAQQIARTYTTSVLDYQTVTARLIALETVKPDPTQMAITTPTPASSLLQTAFVSTLKEEALIDHPPAFNWPSVREGKTEGYMIVYARTDRTGQVRETAKHNSDQPGLEQFGMEQALTLKFHPLLIDGVPQQMEMPLVLHFTSKLADPIPLLPDAGTRAHISGCTLPHAKPGQPPFRVMVSVDEQGKLTGETFPDANTPGAPHTSSVPGLTLRSCKFSPYLINGKPSYYHGDLLLP